MKKSYRGSKIYVHKKKGEADETLVNLYKDSEYAKENKTPKEELNNEDVDEDISAFINDEEDKVKVIESNESRDIKACPGSGKTTVLLAKLSILSNRMPFADGTDAKS